MNYEQEDQSSIQKELLHITLHDFLYQETKTFFNSASKSNFEINELSPADKSNKIHAKMPWLTEINDNYFEFRRPAPDTIVLSFMFSFLLIPCLLSSVLFLTSGKIMVIPDIFFLLALYISLFSVRYSFFTPQAMPVRFNRKNKKIYFLERKVRKNIFARWPLSVKKMDFENVRAWHVSMASSRGASYHAVHLVEFTPDGNNIICQAPLYVCRKPLSPKKMYEEFEYIYSIWVYCQKYMNKKPVSYSFKDNPSPQILANNWLAKWPADIDKESRSTTG
ncbi:DUF6708 domain-containing protein [Leminorella grimontii]|uniref:DUF6708 domain-containing protein n=1 Tax=Leminorella grimontii TaxID=82981 RepID=UPI0021C425B7|nr:DUF6708 domain-containing protein [Leminorella grimontii]